MNSKIRLVKVMEQEIKDLWQMQRTSFAPLLNYYQDYDTNPGNETLERVSQKVKQENSFFYFIKAEDKNVGAIRIKVMPDMVERRISPIFVLPQYQGNGYAQAAIREAERIHGKEHWALETIQQEKRNCHLYEKMGYIWTGKSEVINERLTLILYYK